MTTVGQLGEFPLIERIAKAIDAADLPTPTAGGFALSLGIGDDAAAWRIENGTEVVTTDTVVENVHFTRTHVPWVDVGWKLWAANVSDVVSMGGTPLAGVVTLGLPGDLEVEAIDDLYTGMIDACREYGTVIVGGDIVRSRDVFVSVTMSGVCEAEPLRRDTAKPGDAVAVSGPLGASAGGLRVLRDGLRSNEVLVQAHRHPVPRLSNAAALREAGVGTAMDVSDGLVADLAKLCRASGVAATLDAWTVPIAPALYETFGEEQALLMALGGGEDYEVLFTGAQAAVESAVAAIEGAAVIGEITGGTPGTVRVLDASANELVVSDAGWEHLGA